MFLPNIYSLNCLQYVISQKVALGTLETISHS